MAPSALAMLLQITTLPPLRFDLATARSASLSGEILVTGRREDPDAFRLKRLSAPDIPQTLLPKAEFRLFGQTALAAEGESVLISGFPSNRAMVRLKIGF